MQYTIDVTSSVKALFNINLNEGTESSIEFYCEKSLAPAGQLETWNYYVELVSQETKWEAYYSVYPGFSLYCVKTDFNKITKEAVPHRLFFLVGNRTGQLILLVNKRVAANEHSLSHHYVEINRRVNGGLGGLNYLGDGTPRLLMPLNPPKATQAITATVVSQQSPPLADLSEKEIIAQLDEIDQRILSSRMIINLFNILLSFGKNDVKLSPGFIHETQQRICNKLTKILLRDDIHIAITKDSHQYTLHVQLGFQSRCNSYPLQCAVDEPMIVNKTIIDWLIINASSGTQAQQAALNGFLFLMVSCHPEAILRSLERNQIPLPQTREWLCKLIELLNKCLDTARITPKDYARSLVILQRNKRLKLFPQQHIKQLLGVVMHVWAAEASYQATAGAQTSDDKVTHADVMNILSEAIQFMQIHEVRDFFVNNSDVMDANKLTAIFSLLNEFSVSERCYFLLSLLSCDDRHFHEARTIITSMVSEISHSDEETKYLCGNRLAAFPQLQNASELGELMQFLPEVELPSPSAAVAATTAQPTRTKNKPKRVVDNRGEAQPKETPENFHNKLNACIKSVKIKRNPQKAFVASVKQVLLPYINDQKLVLDAECRRIFIEIFLNGDILPFRYDMLHLAAVVGDTHLVDILLAFCKEYAEEIRQTSVASVLDTACRYVQPNVINLLLTKYQYNPNQVYTNNLPLLLLLSGGNNRPELQQLLLRGLNYLINHGANLNVCESYSNMTALQIACAVGFRKPVIELLLRRGANPNVASVAYLGEATTALDYVVSRKHPDKELEACLKDYGARLGSGLAALVVTDDENSSEIVRDPQMGTHVVRAGNTLPQHLQTRTRNVAAMLLKYAQRKITPEEIVDKIKSGELCINATIGDGFTLLHMVLFKRDIGFFRQLLEEFEPNVNIISINKNVTQVTGSLLHFAIFFRVDELIEPLLEYGANMYSTSTQGFNAFHMAVQYGNHAAIRKMLANGYDIRVKTSEKALNQLASLPLAVFCREIFNPDMLGFVINTQRNPNYQPSLDFLLRQAVIAGESTEIDSVIARGKSEGIDLINAKHEKTGDTPLHIACFCRASRRDYDTILHLLAIPGIQANTKNEAGLTPFQVFAAAHNNLTPPTDDRREKYFEVSKALVNQASKEIMNAQPSSKGIFFEKDGTYKSFASKEEAQQYANGKTASGDWVNLFEGTSRNRNPDPELGELSNMLAAASAGDQLGMPELREMANLLSTFSALFSQTRGL